jgi:hypothetical protein
LLASSMRSSGNWLAAGASRRSPSRPPASGVREILVEVLRHRYPTDPPLVRISHDVIRRVWHRGIGIRKCLMIGAFGRTLRKVDARSGITTNEGFSGIYDFNEERLRLAGLFDRFLQCPGSRMLIMCHPGRSDSELRRIDNLTSQRDAELASVERRVAPAPG